MKLTQFKRLNEGDFIKAHPTNRTKKRWHIPEFADDTTIYGTIFHLYIDPEPEYGRSGIKARHAVRMEVDPRKYSEHAQRDNVKVFVDYEDVFPRMYVGMCAKRNDWWRLWVKSD